MTTRTAQLNKQYGSNFSLSKKELVLLLFTGGLCLIGILGPHIAQYEHYHNFADQSTLLGVPHACDVFSNLPFALIGAWGVLITRRTPMFSVPSTLRDMFLLFFYGLIVTSVCSSIYHLSPDNTSLWLDRLGMTVAFAGMLGIAITSRVSDRAGQVAAYMVLIAGPVSLWVWQTSDNFLAWSMLQGGGMLIILSAAMLPAVKKELRIPLAAVIGWYAISKVLELGDHFIYDLTREFISGHSLKHIFAAFAGLPLILFFYKTKALKSSNVLFHEQ